MIKLMMKSFGSSIVCLTFILLAMTSESAWSQTGDYSLNIKKYNREDGLDISGNRTIVEDNKGYLWLLGENQYTISGDKRLRIAYYDGVRFHSKVFPVAKGWSTDYAYASYALPGEKILFLPSTREQLFIFDKKTLQIKEIFNVKSQYEFIHSLYLQDTTCYLVLKGCEHNTLARLKGNTVEEIFTSELLEDIITIDIMPKGFWVMRKENILLLDFDGNVLQRSAYPGGSCKTCFMGKTNRGIEVFSTDSKPFIFSTEAGKSQWMSEKEFYLNQALFTIVTDDNGNSIYISTKAYDLDKMYLRLKDGEFVDLSSLNKEIKYFNNVIGTNFLEGFWVFGATDLIKIELIPKVATTYLNKEKLRKIKRFDNQLYLITEETGYFKSAHSYPLKWKLWKDCFFSRLLEVTEDGYFLMNNGLRYEKSKGEKKENFDRISYPHDAILLNDSTILVVDFTHVFLIDVKTWKPKMLPDVYFNDVHKMLLHEKNKVYIGHRNGLDELDLSSNASKNLYSKQPVLSICRGVDRQFWLGTANGQLLKMETKSGKTSIMEMAQLTYPIATIEIDKEKRLWLGTYNGVYIYYTHSGEIIKIKDKLLAHTECNRLSSWYDTVYNRMLIGSVHGLTEFNLNKLDIKRKDIHLYIAFVEKYNQDKKKTDTIYYVTGHAERIKLDAQHRSFSVGFAPGVLFDDIVEYDYALVPRNTFGQQDTVWIPNGQNAQVSFTNLQSGAYVLLIKARSAETGQESVPVRMEIEVEEFFYNQWWFYGLIASMLAGLILWWRHHLKEENRKLEGEVDKRTKELQKDKETIQVQAEELSRLDKMKTQFYNNISHELKTPLTLISGPVESIKNGDYIQDPKGKSLVNLIDKNVDLLTRRVEELLELNRLSHQKIILHYVPVNLNEFAYQQIDLFSEEAKRLGMTLKLENKVQHPVRICDEEKIGKMVQNLLANALKYCPAGSTIDFRITDNEQAITLSVGDNGPGIDPVYHGHIFDKFYQIPGGNQANPGSGIGLSIIKEYVDLMKGQILLDSTLGLGTIFTIKIPAAIPEAETVNPYAGSIDEVVAQLPKHEDAHVLVVEDNPDLQSFLSMILSPIWKVNIASNGREAIEKLQSGMQVDLIVSDIMMPEIDGLGLLHFVKQDEKFSKTPFIFLTARTNESIRFSALRLGVDDYMTKPFSEKELVLRIARLLHNYEIRKHSAAQGPVQEEIGDSQMKGLQDFVRQHLTNPTFNVESMADYLGMSERHLRRFMQRETGFTPKEFIMEVQMNLLRELRVNNPDMLIKGLAEHVGYTDPKHMSKLFFERFGYRL